MVAPDSISTLALKRDGSLWAWGRNAEGQLGLGDTADRPTPVRVGSSSDWASIAFGSCALGVKRDGSLWGWGPNYSGEVGVGDKLPRADAGPHRQRRRLGRGGLPVRGRPEPCAPTGPSGPGA